MKTASALVKFLKGLVKGLSGVGGLSFFVGGGLIHAETKMDRFTPEVVGIGVAGACLREAVARGEVGKDSVVLLNVTGGGRRRLSQDYPLIPAQPQLRLTRESLSHVQLAETVHRVTELCASDLWIA